MSVKFKLRVVTGVLALIIAYMFIATWVTTTSQKDDGLLINLAGRQRMLTQKMTKEVLDLHASSVASGVKDAQKFAVVKNTMEVFSVTLAALLDGGEAPLGLDMKNTEFQQCPPATGEVREQLQKVNGLWLAFDKGMDRVFQGNESKQAHLADIDWIVKNNIPLLKEMNSAVGMMQKNSESKVSFLLGQQIAGVVVGLLGVIWAVLIIGGIVSRLSQVEGFVQKLSGGDLTVSSGIIGKDELGHLGKYLDTMSKGLRAMFSDITATSVKLDSGSSNLAGFSSKMGELMVDAGSKADAVASGADQVSSNMAQIAQSATSAYGQSQEVAEIAQESADNIASMSAATEEMSATVAEIASNAEQARTVSSTAVDNVTSASARVDELGLAAGEISKVIDVIMEIAEQTKLLALNATIEAARAGEAGKGFAVVANEVKELAAQTNNATSEIRQKVESMQNSTDNTIGEIKEINDVINNINEIVVNIAGAVEEQAVATQDIAQNTSHALNGVHQMKENAVDMAEGMEKVSNGIVESAEASRSVSFDIGDVNASVQSLAESSKNIQAESVELDSMSSEMKKMLDKFTI